MGKYDIIYKYENAFFHEKYILPIGSILQVAELSIVQDGDIAEHTQICDELTYAISGSATIISGDNKTKLQGGEIHFIKKGVKHRIIGDKNECFRYICIGINFNKNYEPIASLLKKNKSDFMFARDDGSIRALSSLLVNEFYIKDENIDVMINSYLIQIFVNLFRLSRINLPKTRKKEYTCNSSKVTLFEILKYVDREYITIKSVKEVSEYLSYSEDYISHLFKEKMGITLKEYIMQKKIHSAMELLTTSNLKIDEISEFLNFSSPHTFYQAFKNSTSQSPSDFKNSNSGF